MAATGSEANWWEITVVGADLGQALFAVQAKGSGKQRERIPLVRLPFESLAAVGIEEGKGGPMASKLERPNQAPP